jgi:nucleoside-diphosphate kinase
LNRTLIVSKSTEGKVIERTLVLVKPSGVARGLIGEVISRLERRGLTIKVARMLMATPEMAARHYAEHKGKDFYDDLVTHITSAPIFAMVIEGPSAVEVVRGMMGATNPLAAAPGTVRGDFGLDMRRNVVHSADSLASAEREIEIFFPEGGELAP